MKEILTMPHFLVLRMVRCEHSLTRIYNIAIALSSSSHALNM